MSLDNTHRINPDLTSMDHCWWNEKERLIAFDPDAPVASFGFLYRGRYFRFSFEPGVKNTEADFDDMYPATVINSEGGLKVSSSVRHTGPTEIPRPSSAVFLQPLAGRADERAGPPLSPAGRSQEPASAALRWETGS